MAIAIMLLIAFGIGRTYQWWKDQDDDDGPIG